MGRQREAISLDTVVRFGRRVRVFGDCWEWTGAKTPTGYGHFQPAGSTKTVYAHRWAYERAHGPITDGLFVLHRCDNRACVRPAHLFLGTHADNMADMVAKGRSHRHPQVRRWLNEVSETAQGRRLGVVGRGKQSP